MLYYKITVFRIYDTLMHGRYPVSRSLYTYAPWRRWPNFRLLCSIVSIILVLVPSNYGLTDEASRCAANNKAKFYTLRVIVAHSAAADAVSWRYPSVADRTIDNKQKYCYSVAEANTTATRFDSDGKKADGRYLQIFARLSMRALSSCCFESIVFKVIMTFTLYGYIEQQHRQYWARRSTSPTYSNDSNNKTNSSNNIH